ncbi:Conidiation protein 6-domain-containing protein [Aspergillus unguis]
MSSQDEIPDSPQARVDSARGYKAALHNPRVSEESKRHASEMLEKLDDKGSQEEIYRRQEKPKSPNRVVAGLKAAQHNPLVGEEGRREAAEKLKKM